MVTNCRGNPARLPTLRAAIKGRPYNIIFDFGFAGFGGENEEMEVYGVWLPS